MGLVRTYKGMPKHVPSSHLWLDLCPQVSLCTVNPTPPPDLWVLCLWTAWSQMGWRISRADHHICPIYYYNCKPRSDPGQAGEVATKGPPHTHCDSAWPKTCSILLTALGIYGQDYNLYSKNRNSICSFIILPKFLFLQCLKMD